MADSPFTTNGHRVGIIDRLDGAEHLTREQLSLLADRASIAFEGLKAQWRTRLSLGTHERMVLSQLWTHGPLAMNEVASRVAISRGALTDIVDRLEANGWLRRADDPTDRRRTLLQLCRQAEEEFAELAAPYTARIDELANEFDEEQFAAVSRFLARWAEIADAEAADLRRRARR